MRLSSCFTRCFSSPKLLIPFPRCRNPRLLAVTEALLERAEQGERLQYPRYLVPAARVAKAYSSALNPVGAVGPIPEGMSATSALKHEAFVARHEAAAAAVRLSAERFRLERGYEPPYWELVRMARRAL